MEKQAVIERLVIAMLAQQQEQTQSPEPFTGWLCQHLISNLPKTMCDVLFDSHVLQLSDELDRDTEIGQMPKHS